MRWSFGFGKLEKKTIVKLKKNKECQTSSTGYPVNKLKKKDELISYYWSVYKECVRGCVPSITQT
jgi:hypothetical protein